MFGELNLEVHNSLNKKVDAKKGSLQEGFTLIELLMVIVILSVLAAVALAKFTDLSRDARIATIHSIEGALSTAANLVYMKSNIENITDGAVIINGNNVLVNDGYITGHWNKAWTHVLELGKPILHTPAGDECVINDICGVGNQKKAPPGLPIDLNKEKGLVLLWLNGMALDDLCYAFYYNPSDGKKPITGSVISGC